MKYLILLSFLLTPSLFAAENVCRYDHTIYHEGDRFLDTEQCNTCHCEKSYSGHGFGVSCTEVGCLGPRPTEDIEPFHYATSIICQKVNKQNGYTWELKLEDLDGDGEFVLTATRNGQIYYSRNYASHYLVVKKARLNNKIRFYSPQGTVFVDLTRPFGGTVATGYFSTQRFEKQVSNLTCKTF